MVRSPCSGTTSVSNSAWPGVAYPLLELARGALTTADARALWDRAAGTRVRYRLRGTGSLIPTGAPISRG